MAHYLISYKSERFIPLSQWDDGYTVELTIKKTWFFGLIKRTGTMLYTIPDNVSVKKVFDYWDNLIKTQQPLRR